MKRTWPVLFAGCLSACATQSFQPHFTAPSAPTQPVVVSELLAVKARSERPVVVGLTGDPMRLFAWDLQQAKLLWEQPVQALRAPLVAADTVVVQEAGGVVVRELATGAERTRIDDGGALVGADGEGEHVLLTLAYEKRAAPGAVVMLDAGGVRWKQQLNLPVGVAALSGAYVLVPWATQRLSILAAGSGKELSRLHWKSSVIGHALVDREHLYVGQLGLMPLTREMIEQPGLKLSPYAPWKRSLPAQPPLLRDGYTPVPDPDNAQHRLQLSFRIHREGEALRSENDLLLLRFYRLLFALDANADRVAWVRSFDHDLVAAAIQPGSLLIVDARGDLRALDLQGNTRLKQALGRELRVATLRPGAWLPPAAAGDALEVLSGNLNQQLHAAANLEDDRLGFARAYAANQLARSSEPEITAQLITLCSEPQNPEPLRGAACSELRERTTGDAAVLGALRVRASFLEGTAAAPIGPLAQAAAKMQLKQAGPLLVSQMEDPNTPVRDLPAVFTALQALRERSAAPSIERFVRLHHAEPDGSDMLPALRVALETLGALRVPTQRATLLDIANDALSPRATRDAASAALAALDTPVEPPKQAEPEPRAAADEVQSDPRSYALTADVIRKTLTPLRERLGRCLAADPSTPHSGRTSMVIDGAGNVEGVFVMPATLQPCVEPLLRAAKFPSTRLGRQRITHIFHGANAKEPARPKPQAKKP